MQKVTKVLKENATNIAFIGRPNVGKSSLFNRLLGTYALFSVRVTRFCIFSCFFLSHLVLSYSLSSFSVISHSRFLSPSSHTHTHLPLNSPTSSHSSHSSHPLIAFLPFIFFLSSFLFFFSSSGTDRSIVSDVAGTTRDTVDALVVRYTHTLSHTLSLFLSLCAKMLSIINISTLLTLIIFLHYIISPF
jgi:50S ribosome-binding GTPase